jgi:branched-chain amino acid aminotransferase
MENVMTRLQIPVNRVESTHITDVDFTKLEFGRTPTDHMLVSHFKNGAWGDTHIGPFQKLELSPFTLALHYGQTVFEGMKAYRREDGSICIFRLDKHFERINRSLERMCMPTLPYDLFYEGVKTFVDVERNWVPTQPEAALYLRPFVFASEERIRVKASDEFQFLIVASPVGPYYGKPLKVKVETTYVRAAEGGVGSAKCGGNYGGALYPTKLAQEEGFDQVIWTDARYNRYIEESGTMNLFFLFGDTVVTPPLSSSILDGITRDSIIQLAESLGYGVEERKISLDELELRLQDGSLREAFGAGTAAVVAPIAQIHVREVLYDVKGTSESFALKVRDLLSDIRLGKVADTFGWCTILPA